MFEELTDRQREVLELYVHAFREGRAPPTYRDICNSFHWTSVTSAWCHTRALIKKGWLEKGDKNTARSLTLTGAARVYYGLPPRGRAA